MINFYDALELADAIIEYYIFSLEDGEECDVEVVLVIARLLFFSSPLTSAILIRRYLKLRLKRLYD